jgi:hypothetical protein
MARVYGIAGYCFLYTFSEQGSLRRDGTVSGMKTNPQFKHNASQIVVILRVVWNVARVVRYT